MGDVFRITLTGLFFGTFGTAVGGVLGCFFNFNSSRKISFILEFAAGLMLSVICFELIPESLKISDFSSSLVGILFGVFGMMFIDGRVRRIHGQNGSKKSDLLRTGVIVGIGLAIHNFPEGLAIGCGLEASTKLGLAVAIAILIHDVPEGISMAVPLKNGGMSSKRVIVYTVLSGVTTGVGAFIGGLMGVISSGVISFSLAFAAGAMLYIVSGELIPESKKMYGGRTSVVGNVVGFLFGLVLMWA